MCRSVATGPLAHLPVEIDPGSPAHGTRRDANRNAYFEFATDMLPEVRRVITEYGYADRVAVDVVQDGNGAECVNCGYIAPQLATICPKCSFRDIEPCPYCNREIPRLEYISLGGDLFQCPACRHRVRFRFHEHALDDCGHYNQPLVLVSPAEAPSENAVR